MILHPKPAHDHFSHFLHGSPCLSVLDTQVTHLCVQHRERQHRYRQTDRQTDRETDRQTVWDRQTQTILMWHL